MHNLLSIHGSFGGSQDNPFSKSLHTGYKSSLFFFFFYHEFHILSAMQLRLLPGFLALAGKIVLKGPLDMMEPLGKLK